MKNIKIFDGMSEDEIDKIIACTGGYTKEYSKNQFVVLNGEPAKSVTLLLKGTLSISKTDFNGNKIIISDIKEREIFGEAFVLSKDQEYKVDVMATSQSSILFLPFHKLIKVCSSGCSCHNKIIFNLLFLLANKNINLNKKVECLSQKTTQGKIAFYLMGQYENTSKTKFSLPFNREEFSEYLGVNRSALSRELGKLKEKGIIDFNKNVFKIIDLNELEEIMYPDTDY